MQCQNTKQKINDFKQNFETFYIVLWYNDINKNKGGLGNNESNETDGD